jgi:hypothetical protein
MSATTRYEAVREAIWELGPLATVDEIGEYLTRHHKFTFRDRHSLAVYLAMVQRKMSRKPLRENASPSGMFSCPGN